MTAQELVTELVKLHKIDEEKAGHPLETRYLQGEHEVCVRYFPEQEYDIPVTPFAYYNEGE